MQPMKRLLMTFLALWVLLLSPGLCLSGALEHFCVDNPGGTSCEHENNCTSDPCGEALLLQANTQHKAVATPVIQCSFDLADAPSPLFSTLTRAIAELWPQRVNLPVPSADLPLLS